MQDHVRHMTLHLRRTRLPWTDRSRVIGLSTLLFAVPALARSSMPRWKRAACVAQAIVAFYSDYVYAGRPHISHGVDRWLATVNVVLSAPEAIYRGYFFIPASCYYLSMKSIQAADKSAYIFWHTLWHIFGALFLHSEEEDA